MLKNCLGNPKQKRGKKEIKIGNTKFFRNKLSTHETIASFQNRHTKLSSKRREWSKEMKEKVTIICKGHPLVTATHKTTFELTCAPYLTEKGNCIIAVNCNKALKHFNEKVKDLIRKENALIEIKVKAGNKTEIIKAHGHPDLPLNHHEDMVVRKSKFICSRTLAILADKAAIDFNRALINEIKKGGKVIVTVEVSTQKECNI